MSVTYVWSDEGSGRYQMTTVGGGSLERVVEGRPPAVACLEPITCPRCGSMYLWRCVANRTAGCDDCGWQTGEP